MVRVRMVSDNTARRTAAKAAKAPKHQYSSEVSDGVTNFVIRQIPCYPTQVSYKTKLGPIKKPLSYSLSFLAHHKWRAKMKTFDRRNEDAQIALREGIAHEGSGDLQAAYESFRLAHDLVVDCPQLHKEAHQHLRRVNLKRRSYRELATDLFLLGLAPVFIFELVAFMMKGQVLGGVICGRRHKALQA